LAANLHLHSLKRDTSRADSDSSVSTGRILDFTTVHYTRQNLLQTSRATNGTNEMNSRLYEHENTPTLFVKPTKCLFSPITSITDN